MVQNSNKKRKQKSRATKKEMTTAYICLIPAFVGLIFLTYVPLVAVFGLSLFSWKGVGTPEFIGFGNYVKLFVTDPYFKDAIKATVLFAGLAVVGSVLYSLLIAILLNQKIPARSFFRAVFYLPYLLPALAVYIGWAWLYESNFGLFNYILSSFGIEKIAFIADGRYVLPSLAIISVWLAGNLVVIFLAGLQNVPRVYHEAAEIDGANTWQRFTNITLPCMSPIIFYNLLMSLITNLQVVTPALALTNGGPGNSSRFLTYLMYFYAFKSRKFGYASAVSFITFVLIAIFTVILFVTSKKWMFEEGGETK
ncbi:MAG: sugar ABC transporter permease [Lachnospiraceae bacterium]|nr:sugar ABC transporter permease [Lachnospiraceae bacterium]